MKRFQQEVAFLNNSIESLQKEVDDFDMDKLKRAEEFFQEKLPDAMAVFIGLENESQATYAKKYYTSYFLLPRGIPNHMAPARDFQMLLHELIHSLHYKRKIAMLSLNLEMFEYVVRCFAPGWLFFNKNPIPANLDDKKLKKGSLKL